MIESSDVLIGGTELLQPLQFAYEMASQAEKRRVIVITGIEISMIIMIHQI